MLYYFDSSALVKRYHREAGTDAVKEIFITPNDKTIVIASISLCEVISALNKVRNMGGISNPELVVAIASFYSDCLDKKIEILDITRSHLLRANDLILSHNLFSQDAMILSCALDMEQFDPVFVSSDRKLLRAAEQRHFRTLNPEDV